MPNTTRRVKGWLALGAGVAAIAIAFVIEGRREQRPVTVAPASAAAALPNSTVGSPPSTASDRRASARKSDGQPAEDFAAAIKRAVRNGEKLNDDREVFELGYRWMAVDPEAALDFVLAMPVDHTLLLVALVGEWARRDPASASTWAARLPEGARRERVLPSLVAVWAEMAPTDALRFASDLPPGKTKNEALFAAVSGWARQDPPAAIAWAGASLRGKEQQETFTQIVYAWGQRDPVSAAEWLRALPDGAAWDAATSTLCGVLVERYPALALSLAANISDHTLRAQRIENVAQRWLDQDRTAAEHALIQSDLPAEMVSRLLR